MCPFPRVPVSIQQSAATSTWCTNCLSYILLTWNSQARRHKMITRWLKPWAGMSVSSCFFPPCQKHLERIFFCYRLLHWFIKFFTFYGDVNSRHNHTFADRLKKNISLWTCSSEQRAIVGSKESHANSVQHFKAHSALACNEREAHHTVPGVLARQCNWQLD